MTGSHLEIRKRSGAPPVCKISKKVWIKASTETVYKALTDSRELEQWFCDRASSEPCEGKELVAYWKTGKSVQKGCALFTRIVPGCAVELVWINDGIGEQEQKPSHTLTYEIRSKSGMTELIMTDKDDSTPDEETGEVFDQGWNSVLLELKDHCERKERLAKQRQAPTSRSRKTHKD